jgi:hypothetical protein
MGGVVVWVVVVVTMGAGSRRAACLLVEQPAPSAKVNSPTPVILTVCRNDFMLNPLFL